MVYVALETLKGLILKNTVKLYAIINLMIDAL